MCQAQWTITAVDRRTKQQFERVVRLDWNAVPPPVRPELRRLLGSDLIGPGVIKFRPYFREADSHASGSNAELRSFILPDYHEDENARVLDATDFTAVLTGRQIAFLLGDINSILRRGPADMANAAQWTAERANVLDHFIEAIQYIGQSDWITTDTFITYVTQDGVPGPIEQFNCPNAYSLNAVLLLIRQLHSSGDNLFRRACDIHFQHCSDEGKKLWVSDRRRAFTAVLNQEQVLFPLGGLVGRELIDLFLYGCGLVHRSDAQHRAAFLELLRQYERGHILMAFHGTLRDLVGHAHAAFYPIAQDFWHWIKDEQAVGPDRVSIRQLFS